MLREELKRLARAADATPSCAPLAAVEEETPRGAAGSADPTPRTPRPAAVSDDAVDAAPTESGAGCTTPRPAAVAWQGLSPDELALGIDEDEGDPMIALYLA